jgi:hypothetical protein
VLEAEARETESRVITILRVLSESPEPLGSNGRGSWLLDELILAGA